MVSKFNENGNISTFDLADHVRLYTLFALFIHI